MIAVDVGGSNIRIAAFDSALRAIVRKIVLRTPRAASGAQLTDVIAGAVIGFAKEQGLADFVLSICCCGPIDVKTGYLLNPPLFPNLGEYPFIGALQEKLGQRPHLHNDANMAALGEYAFGAGIASRCLLYMTISTGIGGAVVLDGSILEGAFGFAGELGHICVAPNGPLCGCGRKGCLEACASGSALESEAYRAIHQGIATTLAAVLERNGGITMLDITQHARLKDAVAMHVISLGAQYLGEALTSYINIFNPDRIVLGGGLASAYDLLEAGILERIHATAMAPMRTQFRISRSKLGDEAGLYGAFLYAENAGAGTHAGPRDG